MSIGRAAELTGLTAGNLCLMVARGRLPARKIAGCYRLDVEALRSYVDRNRGWVRIQAAAQLVGCSHGRIVQAVSDGDIARRHTTDRAPILSEASVLAFRDRWEAAGQESAARARAAAVRRAWRRPPVEEGCG